MFSPSYPGITGEGGIGTYTRELAHALAGLGYGMHVLSPGAAGGMVQDGPVSVHLIRDGYVPVVERFVPGAGACWRIGAAMRRLVKRHRLDVVEFPNWEGLGVGFSLRRNAPLVVRLHTTSLESAEIDGQGPTKAVRWDIRREWCLARRADALVTHSEAHRARVARELSVDSRRIAVLPHGVTVYPDFVRPVRSGPGSTVVYLGRMERRKGTLDLLRAVPEVLRQVPDARFVLIGADRCHCPDRRTHQRYVADEFPPEVRDHIEFKGRLPDVEVDRYLQTADLFVAPSLYESFGLIFLEAMRWGTPVLGTRAGGIPEIVEDGTSGILVSPGAPDELAAAITRLLLDPGLRRRLGDAGRARVESAFTVGHMAGRAAAFYSRMLDGKGGLRR